MYILYIDNILVFAPFQGVSGLNLCGIQGYLGFHSPSPPGSILGSRTVQPIKSNLLLFALHYTQHAFRLASAAHPHTCPPNTTSSVGVNLTLIGEIRRTFILIIIVTSVDRYGANGHTGYQDFHALAEAIAGSASPLRKGDKSAPVEVVLGEFVFEKHSH